jgi:hypothetical protein
LKIYTITLYYIPHILFVNAKNKKITKIEKTGKIISIQIIHNGSVFLNLKYNNTGRENIIQVVVASIFQNRVDSCHSSREKYQSNKKYIKIIAQATIIK